MSDKADNRNAAGNKARGQGYIEGRQGRSNRKPRPGRVSGGTRPPQQEGRAPQGAHEAAHDAGRPQSAQRQPRSRNRKQFVNEDKANLGATEQRAQNPNPAPPPAPRDNRPNQRQDNRDCGEARGRGHFNRAYQKEAQAVETLEDIRRDNDRIEKEIWLEIADIHTIKLDF